jgi:hypothetical protein
VETSGSEVGTSNQDRTISLKAVVRSCIKKKRLEPSAIAVEMTNEKLKRHKSPGIDQIPAELIKAGGRTFHSEIHKLINSIWNKEELTVVWKELIIVPI